MLTVRLVKYGSDPTADSRAPTHTEAYAIREAEAVYVNYENDGRCVVQLGEPGAPGAAQPERVTVGGGQHCQYSVAYVMNQAGRTVDKIQ